jgi:signal transduction histidine kinase
MRSVTVLGGVVLTGGVVVAVLYDVRGGLITSVTLTFVGAGTLVASALASRHRARLGSLRAQFALIAGLAVGQMLLAVAAGASLMFLSTHDAVVVCVLAAGAGVLALEAARRLSEAVVGDIEVVRDALQELGDSGTTKHVPASARRPDDEVAELADALTATAERLSGERAARDAADTARRDLVAAVSHDLRTPLTSLRLLTQALHDFDSDEDQRRQDLRGIATHLGALSALIDDLFELSRLEAGDISWSLEQVRLGELVDETVSALRVEAEREAIAVRAEVPPDLPTARANPEKLQRVLFNLIQNAIRHTPADGSVTVRASVVSDAVQIEVADTGSGIRAPERHRVFEAFYRGGAAAGRPPDGAGLGLAISRAIVEAHGGRMWIADSRVGARVRFTIPTATW